MSFDDPRAHPSRRLFAEVMVRELGESPLSLPGAAEVAGISQSQLSNILAGRRRPNLGPMVDLIAHLKPRKAARDRLYNLLLLAQLPDLGPRALKALQKQQQRALELETELAKHGMTLHGILVTARRLPKALADLVRTAKATPSRT